MSVNLGVQIPGIATSAAPAWVVFGNKTLMAWKGEGNDNAIYWSKSETLKPDGNSGDYSWQPQQKIPNVGTSAAPALANLKGVIYLVWKGEGKDTTIYWSTLGTNGTWAPQQVVSAVGGTSDGPALAVTGDELYLAWKEEPGGSRIFWSKSSDGKNWAAQSQVSGVATSHGPALASDGKGAMYLAWKGASDSTIWWSKCSDGKSWSSQHKGPGGAVSGPTLAVDSNAVKWLAWNDTGNGPMIIGPNALVLPGVSFSCLQDEAKNQWSAGASRIGAGTGHPPALLSVGGGDAGLMLAWDTPGTDNTYDIKYAPLLLPVQVLNFNIPDIAVKMMRTGHATFKDGSDTDYVSIGVMVKGQAAKLQTKFVGDLTGGQYGVGLSIGGVKVQDTDTVYLHYAVINSSQGASAATSFLESAGSKILNALEKADEAALESATGLPLSSLTPQEAGALIGAQLGNAIIPGFGAVIGAIAGWFVESVVGFVFPDCDGPVAVGIYAFSAAQLRFTLMENKNIYVQTDDNPGVNSASGCGQNSDYLVTWNVAS